MKKEQFIEYITRLGFKNYDPKNISTIESDYFKYSNSDIECYIIFLVDNKINIFAIDILTKSTRCLNKLLSFNGNEDEILKELKNFLKKDIRDILLNDIIDS